MSDRSKLNIPCQGIHKLLVEMKEDIAPQNKIVVYSIFMDQTKSPKRPGVFLHIPRENVLNFFYKELISYVNKGQCSPKKYPERFSICFSKGNEKGDKIFIAPDKNTYNIISEAISKVCENRSFGDFKPKSDRRSMAKSFQMTLQDLQEKNKNAIVLYEIQFDVDKHPLSCGDVRYLQEREISDFYLDKVNNQSCDFFADNKGMMIRFFIKPEYIETVHMVSSMNNFKILKDQISKTSCRLNRTESEYEKSIGSKSKSHDGLNFDGLDDEDDDDYEDENQRKNFDMDGIDFDSLYSDPVVKTFEPAQSKLINFDGVDFNSLYESSPSRTFESTSQRIVTPINFDGVDFNSLYD